MPVSRTEILITWLHAVALTTSVRTSTSPPVTDPGVNLIAFASKGHVNMAQNIMSKKVALL